MENNKDCVCDMSEISLDKKYGTVLFLIRHGESVGNADGHMLGHTDKDLSPLGYEQARRTAEFLSYQHIDLIYSSDLIRAHNTVDFHAKMRGLSVVDSKALREIYLGEWDGKSYEEVLSGYGDMFQKGWRESFGTFAVPGGETVIDAGRRFYAEVKRIASENTGKSIIIGAHAAVIRSFWGIINGIAPENFATSHPYPTNASITVVYFDGEKLIPGEYSHDSHLTDLYNPGGVVRA